MTTVGYGDFGAYNNFEVFITLIWMFIGVAFYTFVVGSLTTIITENQSQQENLNAKLKALEDFSADAKLDPRIHSQIRNFLSNNFKEMF